MDLNDQKQLKQAKHITEYQEWQTYKDYVETVFDKYLRLDNLETETDLQVAKKLKEIKHIITFNRS